MIKWITVWYLIIPMLSDGRKSVNTVTIPYATQEICEKQKRKYEDSIRTAGDSKCVFGQMPIAVGR